MFYISIIIYLGQMAEKIKSINKMYLQYNRAYQIFYFS